MRIPVLITKNIKNLWHTEKKFNRILKKLKKRIKKNYFTSVRIKMRNHTNGCISLESDLMEYITSESLGSKSVWVGSGNCPIDIILIDKNNNKIGIDVCCLSLSKKTTNEKSIMQNFSNCGLDLDDLFKNIDKDKNKILHLFCEQLQNKIKNAKTKYGLNKIFYFVYISTITNVYLIPLELNIDNMKDMKILDNKCTNTSIYFDNFIDDRLGNTKIYKSKKRMELRFDKLILKNENCIQII